MAISRQGAEMAVAQSPPKACMRFSPVSDWTGSWSLAELLMRQPIQLFLLRPIPGRRRRRGTMPGQLN